MATNLVSLMYKREIGFQECGKTTVAIKMLQQLYRDEWCFDHPLLHDLHIKICSLVVRNTNCRKAVMEVMGRWQRERLQADSDFMVANSHVFLITYISEFLKATEREMLNAVAEEIKYSSL